MKIKSIRSSSIFRLFITGIMSQSDTVLINGTIADYTWDGKILVAYSKSLIRTVANITENVALVKSITGGRPVPLLIHLSDSPVPDKETRKVSTTQLPGI
jgi:hypothetical protein